MTIYQAGRSQTGGEHEYDMFMAVRVFSQQSFFYIGE